MLQSFICHEKITEQYKLNLGRRKPLSLSVSQIYLVPEDFNSMYKLCISHSAEKSLSKLPPEIQRAIATTISSLQANPRASGVKKLCQRRNLHRIPCKKDYRIIYIIDDKSHIITVGWIRHRRDAYRHL